MHKITTTLLLALCFYGNLNTNSLGKSDLPKQDTTKIVAAIPEKATHTEPPKKKKKKNRKPSSADLISKAALLDSISDLESSTTGDWKANNHNLYIGRYQIGPEVLIGQGYPERRVRRIFRQFGKNPHVFPAHEQEQTVKVWMGLLEEELQEDIDNYTGRRVNGIRITKAGILAASHRVGSVGVKYWLRRGHCRYTGRVNRTMRRYARTKMKESFKTNRTAYLYRKSLQD